MNESWAVISRTAHSVSSYYRPTWLRVTLSTGDTWWQHQYPTIKTQPCVDTVSVLLRTVSSKAAAYLGESPPWEQFVGEVRGLVLLGVWRAGIRPIVLLGEPWISTTWNYIQRNIGNRSPPQVQSVQLILEYRNLGDCNIFPLSDIEILLTTLLLVLLVFFRWLCSSLVAPSWKVLGSAPSSMVNSGVLSSNKAISTTCAACRQRAQRVRKESRTAENLQIPSGFHGFRSTSAR